MKAFSYLSPTASADAVRLLAEHGPSARLIAGGQSLLLAMKERTERPPVLISLASIDELRGIAVAPSGELVIGATTTYARLARAELPGWHGLISTVSGNLADRPVRTMGTIGGALCAADPRYDMLTLIVATDATLEVLSPAGSRTVSAADFFADGGGTTLTANDILATVRFPPLAAFDAVTFEKYRVRTFDAALVSAACAISLGADGSVSAARITAGAVTPVPVVAVRASTSLLGTPAGGVDAALVGEAVAEEVLGEPGTEAAVVQYQRELLKVVVRTALSRALDETRS